MSCSCSLDGPYPFTLHLRPRPNPTNMKYTSLFALCLLALTFTACEDDEDPFAATDTEFTLTFRSEYDAQPLAIQSATYDYPGGNQLKMLLFQYYVSDLSLLPADGGDAVRLSEIELIQYMSATGDADEARTYTAPLGSYSGIQFGLGVKPELNALAPSNFSANDPLNENEFWNDRARYVFAKIEANLDLEPDGLFDESLTLHMGSNDLYRTVTLNQPFTLRPGGEELTIVADVLQAMGGTAAPYNIDEPANRRVHGGNQATAAAVFSGLAGAFTLRD